MAHRIYLAVKNRLFSEGLCAMLQNQRDFCLVGTAFQSDDAIQKMKRLKPEILILDSLLAEGAATEIIHHIQVDHPDLPILWLAEEHDSGLASVIMGLGIKGYLPKDCDSKELFQAIRVLVVNGIYVCPKIGKILFPEIGTNGKSKKVVDREVSVLTTCEYKVMVLLVEGKTNKAIADFLGVSIKTVHAHRTQLMKKLQIDSLPELTKFAIQHEIISLN